MATPTELQTETERAPLVDLGQLGRILLVVFFATCIPTQMGMMSGFRSALYGQLMPPGTPLPTLLIVVLIVLVFWFSERRMATLWLLPCCMAWSWGLGFLLHFLCSDSKNLVQLSLSVNFAAAWIVAYVYYGRRRGEILRRIFPRLR